MPKTIKTLLFLFALDLIVFCAAGVGFLRHHETQAAEQTLSVRQQEAGRFLAQDTAVDEVAPRSASYEACVRSVRDDYSDDPVKAHWWVKTLCR